jgi:LuxR family transcriptional regulator, maltose regulon positive regulatory protein
VALLYPLAYNGRVPTRLLQTKLQLPRVRRSLVARPHLLRRIGAARALTLIAAPAGFGKTTLLAAWVAQAPQRCAWLSLDAGDNDPAYFWAYLIAALQTVAPDAGRDAQALLERPPAGAAIVTALLNDAAKLADPATLILDDYHVISAAPIHAALAYLIDHLPAQLSLVISTRAEPGDLPLARLRARGQLAELRADDLRFSLAESAAFLGQEIGGLTREQIAALESRTEGWVAGLQLAALAMQGGQSPDALIAHFSGARRDLAGYLLAEVYGQQPPEAQSFLAQTALLERMTGALCDAVTGRSDGAATLERLARSNLFVSALDAEGGWYRYHQLFREFLLQRQPADAAQIHRRAAGWLAGAGQHAAAVHHMLQSGDAEGSAALIAEHALDVMMRADIATLRGWLAQLPAAAILADPRLCLAQVWLMLDLNQPDQAARYLEQAHRLLAEARQPALLAEALTLRAVAEAMAGNPDGSLALAQQAQQLGGEGDAFTRALLAYGLGAAYKMGNDGLRAEQCLREAGIAALAAGSSYLAIEALGNLGDLQIDLGRLPEAERSLLQTLEQTRAIGGLDRPASGWIYWDLGRIHYEWDDLAAAIAEAERAAQLCAAWGNSVILVRALLLQAQIWQARQGWMAADAALDQAELIAQQASHALRQMVLRRRFVVALARHDLPLAEHLAERVSPPSGPIPYYHSFMLARLALAQGQPRRALADLRLTWESLEQTNLVTGRIQALCLEALARRAMGQREHALQPLERALALAAPGRFVRSFIEHGAPMEELLRRAAPISATPDYVQRLLAVSRAQHTPEPPLVRLTDRERQIMRLLATGLSNRELADHLVISEGTLKRHLSNLYLKLAVSSRTQAVARARDLHLIAP